ncbi:MAG: hypothetical protein Q9182_004921 [Xanthomendoza sp. 2 TL-2023]
MSIATPDSLDSICQMAPHIILLDPVDPHPHRNLYHQMLLSERRILEHSRTPNCAQIPHVVARRARSLQARLARHFDPEQYEALQLLERSRTHKLAKNYRANASTTNLAKKMKDSSETSSRADDDDEPESCEIIEVKASYPC